MADTRIERDCLGEMEIPNDRYYGIQTTRMKKVSGAAHQPIVFYPDIFRAMAHIKKAAALTPRSALSTPKSRKRSPKPRIRRWMARTTTSSRSTCGRAAVTPAST